MAKSITLGVFVFLVLIGFLVFTTWGFNPKSWMPEMRALAYALVIVLSFGSGIAIYESKDDA